MAETCPGDGTHGTEHPAEHSGPGAPGITGWAQQEGGPEAMGPVAIPMADSFDNGTWATGSYHSQFNFARLTTAAEQGNGVQRLPDKWVKLLDEDYWKDDLTRSGYVWMGSGWMGYGGPPQNTRYVQWKEHGPTHKELYLGPSPTGTKQFGELCSEHSECTFGMCGTGCDCPSEFAETCSCNTGCNFPAKCCGGCLLGRDPIMRACPMPADLEHVTYVDRENRTSRVSNWNVVDGITVSTFPGPALWSPLNYPRGALSHVHANMGRGCGFGSDLPLYFQFLTHFCVPGYVAWGDCDTDAHRAFCSNMGWCHDFTNPAIVGTRSPSGGNNGNPDHDPPMCNR